MCTGGANKKTPRGKRNINEFGYEKLFLENAALTNDHKRHDK